MGTVEKFGKYCEEVCSDNYKINCIERNIDKKCWQSAFDILDHCLPHYSDSYMLDSVKISALLAMIESTCAEYLAPHAYHSTGI